MKIPQLFIPEKRLENKIEQLTKEPKTCEKEYKAKYNKELEKLLTDFDPMIMDYDMVHSEVIDLAEKIGYKQTNKKSSYEYWAKPTGFGESYILVSLGKKFEKHYIFARIKDEKFQKFYKRLEHQRKMVYPKSLLIISLYLSASLTMAYACSSLPVGNFLKDIASWMAPSIFTAPMILSAPSVVKYARKRVGKGLGEYCTGLIIGDDTKALEAAFS